MTAETFKNVAEGIQSTVLAVGLLVGAIWTLWTFRHLATAQKASADLAEIERSQQPAFAITIVTNCSAKRPDDAYELFVTLELRDDGRQNIQFKLDEPCVLVAKLKSENIGSRDFGKDLVLDGKTWQLSSRLLQAQGLDSWPIERAVRPGESRHLAFVTLVPSRGNYLIQANVTYRPMDLQDGQLVEATGDEIEAIEQQIVTVPCALPSQQYPQGATK